MGRGGAERRTGPPAPAPHPKPMAEPTQPIAVRQTRPETSAWLVLLLFFMIFCALVAGAGILGWRYYTGAVMRIDDLPTRGRVIVHARSGVDYQSRGSARFVTPDRPCQPAQEESDVCVDLKEEDRVRARPEAGYGPVASITLPDETRIDLYAHPTGADLTLSRYHVTRWSRQRQEVVFQQSAGYARYDIASGQPYEQVRYSVEISRGVSVWLAPGGSYSINVPRGEFGRARVLPGTGSPALAEVAVRVGHAEVRGLGRAVALEPGERVQVDTAGRPDAPRPAAWELIKDGDFTQHTTEEYNAGSDTWSVLRGPLAQGMPPEEQNGTFRRTPKTCPPDKPNICEAADQVYVGQFRREGGQARNYLTSITQTLDLDVSEMHSLRFSAWTRVLTQSVALAGVAGSECPIMLVLHYRETSPTDAPQRYNRCFYTGGEAQVKDPNIQYTELPLAEWYHLDNIELRDDMRLKRVRYLQEISIEARGHDYVSDITGISLIGTQCSDEHPCH